VLDLSGYGLCFHGSNSTADILRVIVLHNLALKATFGSTRNKGTTHTHTGLGNYRSGFALVQVRQVNDKLSLNCLGFLSSGSVCPLPGHVKSRLMIGQLCDTLSDWHSMYQWWCFGDTLSD
jgi:hypothetical protein